MHFLFETRFSENRALYKKAKKRKAHSDMSEDIGSNST
jgi:hypothetical protein